MWPHFIKLKCSLKLERNESKKKRSTFKERLLIIYTISPLSFLHFLNPHHAHSSEAKAIILGQSDLYVKMGSKVILTCVISQGPHDLGTISWYRGKYTCSKWINEERGKVPDYNGTQKNLALTTCASISNDWWRGKFFVNFLKLPGSESFYSISGKSPEKLKLVLLVVKLSKWICRDTTTKVFKFS